MLSFFSAFMFRGYTILNVYYSFKLYKPEIVCDSNISSITIMMIIIIHIIIAFCRLTTDKLFVLMLKAIQKHTQGRQSKRNERRFHCIVIVNIADAAGIPCCWCCCYRSIWFGNLRFRQALHCYILIEILSNYADSRRLDYNDFTFHSLFIFFWFWFCSNKIFNWFMFSFLFFCFCFRCYKVAAVGIK